MFCTAFRGRFVGSTMTQSFARGACRAERGRFVLASFASLCCIFMLSVVLLASSLPQMTKQVKQVARKAHSDIVGLASNLATKAEMSVFSCSFFILPTVQLQGAAEADIMWAVSGCQGSQAEVHVWEEQSSSLPTVIRVPARLQHNNSSVKVFRAANISMGSSAFAYEVQHTAPRPLPALRPRGATKDVVLSSDTMTVKMPRAEVSTHSEACIGLVSDSQYGAGTLRELVWNFENLGAWPAPHRTSPGPGTPLEVIEPQPLPALCGRSQNLDLLVHGGDFVHEGGMTEWQQYAWSPMHDNGFLSSIPLLATVGNHDVAAKVPTAEMLGVSGARLAGEMLGRGVMTCASVSVGPIFLVTVNSLTDNSHCLDIELSSSQAQGAAFRVLITHVPPYVEFWEPQAWEAKGEKHQADLSREVYLPIAKRTRVDLFIAGHSHVYQRSSATSTPLQLPVLATIGGGGGNLEDLSRAGRVADTGIFAVTKASFHSVVLHASMKEGGESLLEWVALSQEMEVLDSFTISAARTGVQISSAS